MDLDDYDQIPEEKIRNMARAAGPDSSIHRLVGIADEWRAANCTPVFIVTESASGGTMIACVSVETFGKLCN